MTLIVLEVDGASELALFQDARLETIQYLLSQGCYGPMTMREDEPQRDAIWDTLAAAITNAHRIELADSGALEARQEQIAELAASGMIDYLHVQMTDVATASALASFDSTLASLLTRFGQDDILALIGRQMPEGVYLIVAAENPLNGQAAPASVSDLALTLLALDGRPRPEGISGEALFLEPGAEQPDEDAELRERFRGLGYIA